MVNPEFYGCLKDFGWTSDNVKLNDATVGVLLRHNVIYAVNTYDGSAKGDDLLLKSVFVYNYILYRFNDNLLDEIFHLLYQCICHSSSSPSVYDDYVEEKEQLYSKLNSLFDNKDKIKFLKKQFKKKVPKHQQFSSYSKYVKPFGELQFVSWKRSIINLIEEDICVLRLYLTFDEKKNPKVEFIPGMPYDLDFKNVILKKSNAPYWSDYFDTWLKYYMKELMLQTIVGEIEKLSKSKSKSKSKSEPKKTSSVKSINNNDINLESLFDNKELYLLFISNLKENKIVDDKEHIIIPEQYKIRGDKSYLCAIVMQLTNCGFLKFCDDTVKIKAFNTTFNTSITKQNYNSLFNSKNQSKFLRYTDFLKNIK